MPCLRRSKSFTAHDIGLKDLLDAFYLLGKQPDVTLFAIPIACPVELQTNLSPELEAKIPEIAKMVLQEVYSFL
ncbi:MAG: hypothetical protein D6814_09120 [Calditrichaeota bacterium]|nr:MAG: hypothetical protein D6814_09120 [Calditrichota bacterium]